MNSKIKILIGVLIVGIVLIGGWLMLKTSKTVEVEFPIDSKGEAIAYAKTDPEIQKFSQIWEKTNTRVYFNENKNIWTIRFIATEVTDVCLEISFRSDGTIINKYDPCEA